ncbi:hypothetical protein Rhe02_10930 [Rhizocola hellebori]|uniref:ER-bound oxygenase mpaB/mpaB'/Rubber oxygenase catalytic domain-containing protein n=1 Tax=Rhizocola hellebori TaxID=1392758 RepID=A0A8J3VE58_9ACTN|nr:hypothetical protein Rhe02_10930 [Rhizocola hellebori]
MERTPEQLLEAAMLGAGLLGGTANVIMQLARPEVGYGVVESTVDSGKLFLHPVKRTRTTLAYLAVAAIGTDEERRLYRRAVDRSHAPVRSTESSPVTYNAFDQDLQLWVAACLYRGFADTHRLFVGPLTDAEAEALYQVCSRLGTTLQLKPERWPPDRAAFEDYWNAQLERIRFDDPVREHLEQIMLLRYAARPMSVLLGPFHRFTAIGFLPPPFRERMGLRWSARQQRRFDRMIKATALFYRILPGPLRRFPFNAVLWDVRRRIRSGKPLV